MVALKRVLWTLKLISLILSKVYHKNAILTYKGIDKIEKLALQKNILKNENFYDPANLELVHHTNQALKANLIFKKDTDYIVSNGKVQIIDEFTGRVSESYDEKKLKEYMEWDSIEIEINLKLGNDAFKCFTCDFTHDYIDINADYRN